jgi:mRNA interferase RelE/StbE
MRWTRGLRRGLPGRCAFAADPYAAPNVEALKGGGFRLRVGNWRVLYDLRDDLLVVLVARVAHRREVYRRGRGKGA